MLQAGGGFAHARHGLAGRTERGAGPGGDLGVVGARWQRARAVGIAMALVLSRVAVVAGVAGERRAEVDRRRTERSRAIAVIPAVARAAGVARRGAGVDVPLSLAETRGWSGAAVVVRY